MQSPRNQADLWRQRIYFIAPLARFKAKFLLSKTDLIRSLGQRQHIRKTSRLPCFRQADFDKNGHGLAVCFSQNLLDSSTASPAQTRNSLQHSSYLIQYEFILVYLFIFENLIPGGKAPMGEETAMPESPQLEVWF